MKRCAITGAADGIGRALAFAFGRAGYAIHGVDFDAERAAETAGELAAAGIEARFTQADLSGEEGIAAAVAGLGEGPPFDVVVHNAGINAVGAFADARLEPQKAVLGVNLLAPMLLTAALLRGERLRAEGSLVFLSSLSRFVGYPGAVAYAASKDGLAAYARSLRVALAPRGTQVLTVYPGPTRTAHARRYSPDNTKEERRMAPDELAERILGAVRGRRQTLVPGIGNRVFAVLGHLAPGVCERAMKKAILDKLPQGGDLGG